MKSIILILVAVFFPTIAYADTLVGKRWLNPDVSKKFPNDQSIEFRIHEEKLIFRVYDEYDSAKGIVLSENDIVFRDIKRSKGRFLAAFGQIEKWNEIAKKLKHHLLGK